MLSVKNPGCRLPALQQPPHRQYIKMLFKNQHAPENKIDTFQFPFNTTLPYTEALLFLPTATGL